MEETRKSSGKKRTLLQRAVLRWLQENEHPAGMATGVSTRITKYRADIAAFWNHKVRNSHHEGPGRILKPHRSLIVECYIERDECWPDCAKAQSLIEELKKWKKKRSELEDEIRRHEPELRDNNVLFSEYAEWRYDDSDNQKYHRIKNKILKMEQALLKGTRLERICRGSLADQLILAVPREVVMPEEMADGWGLIWVNNDLSLELKREPVLRECLVDNRMHLVQNIASAASSAVLFAAGIHKPHSIGEGEKAVLVQPPRGHRRPKRFRLDDESFE